MSIRNVMVGAVVLGCAAVVFATFSPSVERDARIGGTTVSAEVLPIGLFHAWNRQVIAGPAWDLVTNAVCLAGDRLPDFPSLRAELATDEGLKSLTARVVVDATGNGAVAAFAGAERLVRYVRERQRGRCADVLPDVVG